MDAWLVALIATQLAFFAFLLWLGANHHQKKMQRRSEERLRIVERFGSAKELSDFLDSDSGRRFLDQFAIKARSPAGMVIAGLVVGVLLIFGGGAFLILAAIEDENFLIVAILVLAAAFGVLAATALSYRLARKFRLLSSDRLPALDDRSVSDG